MLFFSPPSLCVTVDSGSVLLLSGVGIGLQGLGNGNGLRQDGEQTPRVLPRVLGQDGIHDDQRGHGLDNGDGAGDNARVVASLGLEHTLALVVGHCVLGLADGGGGLETDGKVDWCAVGDAALDAAGVVGLCGQTRAGDVGGGAGGDGGGLDKGVVVDGAGDLAAAEA